MNLSVEKVAQIRPDLIRWTGEDGSRWPKSGAFLSIGVTAPTQQETPGKFCSVYSRWIEILNAKGLEVPRLP